MWKRALVCIIALIMAGSFGYALSNDHISAAGYIDGSPNNEAANSLKLGDSVHMGGSAMSDDMHTVLGIKDEYLYLLRADSSDNGTLSDYNNALSYANTTYKTQLGSVGSAHMSLSGNAVSLISKTELQNLGLVTNDALDSVVPQISDKWWLRDANTSTNRASFVSADNSLNGDSGIQKTTVSETVYNDPTGGGICGIESTGEIGVMPITTFNADAVAKAKYVSYANIKLNYSYSGSISEARHGSLNCGGSGTGGTTSAKDASMAYTNSGGSESYTISTKGIIAGIAMADSRFNWIPKPIINSSGDVEIQGSSSTTISLSSGTCYNAYSGGNPHINADTNKGSQSYKIKTDKSIGISASISGTPTVTDVNCPTLTNQAGSALIRPYLKIAVNDILMRNNAKRTYSPSTVLNTSGFPKSDNAGEYLTLETGTINVGLRSGITGVSGNRYEVEKPLNSTIVSLPLSFSGQVEGDRYVSAEATDKNGDTVYSVLKAVGSATSDSVDIDFENLLTDGSTSFEVTLYLEDAGSKNTAYRSQGTPITVQFIKSKTTLSFTKPDVTNIKIGSTDVKETIITDNTEITTSGDNAVKYSLSGGISGTGLTVANDPNDSKAFTISIGNNTNPSLPADFTLTAELETTNSLKAVATKKIHVFQELSDFKWTANKPGTFLPSEVESGKAVGNLEVKNGLPKYVYELTSSSDSGYDPTKAKDNGNFILDNTPLDTTLDTNKKAVLKTNTTLLPGTYNIQCKVTDAYGDVLYTDFIIAVSSKEQGFIYTDFNGTELAKTGNKYSDYKETYQLNKTFQLYTSGYPTGSTVTYQLKSGGSTDVIQVDTDGLVTVLNASQASDMGKVVVQATSHDPSGTYIDETIELPITIEKGTRTVSFADDPIYVSNGKGSITPSVMVDGVLDSEGSITLEVNTSEAWTNDGVTIKYNYSGDAGINIPVTINKPANRNYQIATGIGTLHILGTDENLLTLSTPGKIEYGDHFTIRNTQDDSNSQNVKYMFETDNQTFISAPKVNGNQAEFDAIGNSGDTQITVTVTRTADGEVTLTKQVKIKVLPKSITIHIDDKEKKRLEENPPLTFQDISDDLVTWNGVKDNIDTSVIKLSTTAQKYSPIGSYPISGKGVDTLNDNYPNYIFSLKDGLLNVLDNGNKDFWDSDDDGCPDLNIKLSDDEGNTIVINRDSDDDGIPDYNIDIDGDGKPDLNIDTDKDGFPDINITFLKEWKPTQCVTVNGVQYSSGITGKPQINIDLDGDKLPDLNIDTEGKGKPTMNIDTDKDGKANLNTGIVKQWHPDTNVDYNGNHITDYDTDTDLKGLCNIDTDGDGLPDLNIDIDSDGLPDLNINTDGKLNKPQINIDGDGDGIPDINVDTDGDGEPDENIMDITEWKPDHNVKDPFSYDTMKIEEKKELEDNGVKVEKPDGTFPANITLKVTDITKDKKAEVSEKAKDLIGEQSVIQVFDVKLLENGKEIQPDGILKVKIPVKTNIQNPSLLVLNENGEYEKVEAIFENGYLIYETDHLGQFTIIGDIMSQEPNREVDGVYYPGDTAGSPLGDNMGGVLTGAFTGDTTNVMIYFRWSFMACGVLFLLLFKRGNQENK